MRAVTVNGLTSRKFKTYEFTGVWKDTFGSPETNCRWFVFGESGNGKTSFLTQLANYVAKNFGKVAYVSSEEGFSVSLIKAFERAKLSKEERKKVLVYEHLTYEQLTNEIKTKRGVKLWILDSINYLNYTADETKELLLSSYKGMIAVVGWGEGKQPKGDVGKACRFMSSIKVRVEKGKAYAVSRYGSNGQPFIISEELAAKWDSAIAQKLAEEKKRNY